MKYGYVNRFNDRAKDEDEKGAAWDAEDLKEFAFWETDGGKYITPMQEGR